MWSVAVINFWFFDNNNRSRNFKLPDCLASFTARASASSQDYDNIKKCIYQCKSQKTIKSIKKLGMYNSGPICQYPRAYLGFHIPKGFIGTCTTANSHNPTKWLPQNCVLSLAVHGITHNTGIKCKKIVPKNMLAGPKGGKWLANPPNPPHLDPLLRTPPPPHLLITWNTNNSHHHIFQLWPLLLAVFPP